MSGNRIILVPDEGDIGEGPWVGILAGFEETARTDLPVRMVAELEREIQVLGGRSRAIHFVANTTVEEMLSGDCDYATTYGQAVLLGNPLSERGHPISGGSARLWLYPVSRFEWVTRTGIDAPVESARAETPVRTQASVAFSGSNAWEGRAPEAILSVDSPIKKWVVASPCEGWMGRLSTPVTWLERRPTGTEKTEYLFSAEDVFIPFQSAVYDFLSGSAEHAHGVKLAPTKNRLHSGDVAIGEFFPTGTVDLTAL